MKTSLQDLTIRNPTIEDAQLTLDLMIRCDLSEYGLPDSDMDDLLYDWSQIDLERDAWLAFTPGGDLVGYGAVLSQGANLQYDFYVDPAWEDENLGRSLLARCEARGLALAEMRGKGDQILAQIYIPHVNQRDRKTVDGASFRPVKYIFNMQVKMDSSLPTPRWPEGVSIRTAVPGRDDRFIHQFIQAAFDRDGRKPQPFEGWKAFMMRADIFDPDLWFLAIVEEEIVGACLCFAYTEEGWVRQLGVAENWRRRGLGAALLHNAFGEFKQRGFERVGLAVEGDNQNAYIFYEKVGMQQIRQYIEYQKPVGT